jgi:hypothetical protein
MSGENLPKHGCPFKQDIRDIEGVQDPSPLRRAKTEGVLGASGLGIAYVTTVEIREDIKAADDGQNSTVELEWSLVKLNTLILRK